MKKIALISIQKNPTSEDLRQVHRLLSAQTAHVEKIPSRRELFMAITDCGTPKVFRCLRADERSPTNYDSIDGHDAIIYVEVSHDEIQPV